MCCSRREAAVRVVHHSCDKRLLWWLVCVLVVDSCDHRRLMHLVVDGNREMRGVHVRVHMQMCNE